MRGESDSHERSLWGKQGMWQVALPRRRGLCLRMDGQALHFHREQSKWEIAMRHEDLAQAGGRSSLSVKMDLDNGTSY